MKITNNQFNMIWGIVLPPLVALLTVLHFMTSAQIDKLEKQVTTQEEHIAMQEETIATLVELAEINHDFMENVLTFMESQNTINEYIIG